MTKGWGNRLFNNSDKTLYVRSTDNKHNGNILEGSTTLHLEGGGWVAVPPGEYDLEYFKLPWYHSGEHYKEFAFATDRKSGIHIYQTVLDGANIIMYEEIATGITLVKQEIPKKDNYRFKVLVEEGGACRIELVSSNENFGAFVLDAVGKYIHYEEGMVKAMIPVLEKAMKL